MRGMRAARRRRTGGAEEDVEGELPEAGVGLEGLTGRGVGGDVGERGGSRLGPCEGCGAVVAYPWLA
jgi:hypothetical protein